MMLARTGEDRRHDAEVLYYGQNGENPHGFFIEPMDSHGGWIASAIGLARLFAAMDGFGGTPDVLSPDSLKAMTLKPGYIASGNPVWYGLGLSVRQNASGRNWWHTGSLPGTHALYVRAFDGTLWVALFNSRPREWQEMSGDIDQSMWRAKQQVKHWPAHDLFADYP